MNFCTEKLGIKDEKEKKIWIRKEIQNIAELRFLKSNINRNPKNEEKMMQLVNEILLDKYLFEFYKDFVPVLKELAENPDKIKFLHRLCHGVDEKNPENYSRLEKFFIPYLIKIRKDGKEYFGFEPNNKFTILVQELVTESGELKKDVLKKYARLF